MIASHDRSIIALVRDAQTQISKYFPNAQTCIGIDPDEEDKLLLTITAGLEADEAFKMLQEFDEKWWLDNLDRAQGRLSIYLELY